MKINRKINLRNNNKIYSKKSHLDRNSVEFFIKNMKSMSLENLKCYYKYISEYFSMQFY